MWRERLAQRHRGVSVWAIWGKVVNLRQVWLREWGNWTLVWQSRTMSVKLRNVHFVVGASGHWSLLAVVKPARQAWRVMVKEARKAVCKLMGPAGVCPGCSRRQLLSTGQATRKLAYGRLHFPGVGCKGVFLGHRNQILFPACLSSCNTVSVHKMC